MPGHKYRLFCAQSRCYYDDDTFRTDKVATPTDGVTRQPSSHDFLAARDKTRLSSTGGVARESSSVGDKTRESRSSTSSARGSTSSKVSEVKDTVQHEGLGG